MASVVISHPDKVLFPDDGITKGELAAYYDAIAPLMLPHLKKRPVTMERFHKGIGQPGFIQKSIGKGTPDWIERVEVPKKDGTVVHPLINDGDALLWLANQNCITPHVWVSRVPHLDRPDVCIFDLDPLQDDIDTLRTAALWVRDLLAELGLTCFVKTSGSKGFHIAVPLNGKADAGEVSTFSGAVGHVLVNRFPNQLTQEFSKADRKGRIYVDTGRNHPPATFACAYAVRPKPTAPISAPCTWEEVENGSVEPQTFTIRNIGARVAKLGDLWSQLHRKSHSLGPSLKKVRALL